MNGSWSWQPPAEIQTQRRGTDSGSEEAKLRGRLGGSTRRRKTSGDMGPRERSQSRPELALAREVTCANHVTSRRPCLSSACLPPAALVIWRPPRRNAPVSEPRPSCRAAFLSNRATVTRAKGFLHCGPLLEYVFEGLDAAKKNAVQQPPRLSTIAVATTFSFFLPFFRRTWPWLPGEDFPRCSTHVMGSAGNVSA